MRINPPSLGNLATVTVPVLSPLNLDRYDAGLYLGISVRTLANLRTDGKLIPITINGRVLYPKSTLDAFQAERIAASKSEGAA